MLIPLLVSTLLLLTQVLAKAGPGSHCKSKHDCFAPLGASPTCVKGKCAFQCVSKYGFKLSANHKSCTKTCKKPSDCCHYLDENATATCTLPAHSQTRQCGFACKSGYVKSSDGVYCIKKATPQCTKDSQCKTTVANAIAMCVSGKCGGFKCKTGFELDATKKACVPIATDCTNPTFALQGASQDGFNAANTPFSITSSCALNQTAYVVLVDGAPVFNTSSTAKAITLSAGLDSGYKLVTLLSRDLKGDAHISGFALLFGDLEQKVHVVDVTGQPVASAIVTANATTFPGLGAIGTTDKDGMYTFKNLFATTLSLLARAGNQTGFAGVASTDSMTTEIVVRAFGSSTTPSPKRAQGFTVATGGSPTVQQDSRVFTPQAFTKTAFVDYIFQTDEVPGGYFGSQYNDYFSVSLQSDVGAFDFDTNSMNALGLAAFDATGATGTMKLTLDVTDAVAVEVTAAVSNVADSALQSKIVVTDFGDLTCQKCGSEATCPGDPMYLSTCKSPTPQSCSFYLGCVESSKKCGPAQYATAYGASNCHKFQQGQAGFSANGQAWLWKTMLCLQTYLASRVNCDLSCDTIAQTAFDSHPTCYVDSGFCGLSIPDYVRVFTTVAGDLFTLEAVKEGLQTGGLCHTQWEQRVAEYINLLLEEPGNAANIALITAIQIVKQFVDN